MKKKLLQFLSLVLCMLFICPAALAQGGDYVIGQTAAGLLGDALANGKMLTATTKMSIEPDAAALGLSEEEAAQFNQILGVLEQATFTGGFGLISEGFRLTLAGEVADAATGETVGVDAALNVTLDGVSLESDMIEGRRFTAKWESLLALAGANPGEIKDFIALRDAARSISQTGIEPIIAELAETFVPFFQTVAQIGAPYLTTITEFVYSLPLEIQENLNEEGYPPTAAQISIVVTAKDLGDLLTQLCDQAQQDAALKQLFDHFLAAYAEGVTFEQLLSELRAAAAEMTDTSMPLVVFLGLDENDVPLYLEGVLMDEASGEYFYAAVFFYHDADGRLNGQLIFALYNSEGTPSVLMYTGGNHLADPADPNVQDFEFNFTITEEGDPLIDYVIDYTAVRSADSELPAYDITVGYNLLSEDDTHLAMGASGTSGLTAAGGEYSVAVSQADIYIDTTAVSAAANAETLIEPTADGGVAGYYRVSESIPFAGITSYSIDAALASEVYDPAQTEALALIELETITNDELDALIAEVSQLTDDKLVKLMNILPEEIVMMIATQSE